MRSVSFTRGELEEALVAITSTLGKCEKAETKLKPGTPQHTLLVRRIRALDVASVLIHRELESLEG